jgi:hypothetical protein
MGGDGGEEKFVWGEHSKSLRYFFFALEVLAAHLKGNILLTTSTSIMNIKKKLAKSQRCTKKNYYARSVFF